MTLMLTSTLTVAYVCSRLLTSSTKILKNLSESDVFIDVFPPLPFGHSTPLTRQILNATQQWRM